ncbi:energy-coupling factor transporter ATPase [Garciella nitratireducens]|uniref:Energy-coupling factor transporter ATP-binding protein EcfA2 n=1 Tax=Garciella nitratireducens DSM 15102 TaxID=1121911 RepID=A0A1T4PRC2_9FIRM|nr:energy-coupling factor transporter ATPase [Garciella nitratireducens]RBP44911.1 energy-coupling factor transport system ATP-binding protein [Garciella nitratireducens]SJZ93831.1 energy-coupling factor transport system ATP-binding protein [Garciella nitratireducens DSM 15102]
MSIKIENLSHIYMKGTPFEKHALKRINLEIQDGEFIGLIGHTGSGKSTLIQHLNGLLKPTSGTIIIDDLDIADKNVKLKEVRKKVGLVFQYPEHQLFEETIYKDIAFGPQNLGLEEKEIEKRVKQSMEQVGLDFKELKEKSPFELSGGQKRRVAIAGVLAMKPDVLILDEPTAGLDPRGRDEILGQIKKLHKSQKITIILVSHSMEDISKLADKIIVMHDGEIVLFGSPEEVFQQVDLLEKIGLAAPQISYLMKKLKKKDPEIRDNIYTVEEATQEILKMLRRRKNA